MFSWLAQTVARILAIFRSSSLDRHVEEELATHVEMLTGENVRRGMEPIAARRAAQLQVGSREGIRKLRKLARDERATRAIPGK